MRLTRSAINALMVFTVCLFCASFAQAQATRTWVSGVGDDANPCSRTAPCKTFAGAISKTAAGGEINCLDPGGFGAVTITKSITIDGGGTFASILAAGTNGIVINAGVNDVVNIRNLSINGIGTGLNGIRFLGGKSLTVTNCEIFRFTQNGIDVNKTAASELYVKDTRISTCTLNGIKVTTTPSPVLGTIDNTHIDRCGSAGLRAERGSRLTVNRCVITNNPTGILVDGTGADSIVNVEHTTVVYSSSIGIHSSTLATVRINNCMIANNITGTSGSPGSVISGGTNFIQGNTTNTAGNFTGVGTQ
ncbi:MAG: right-handed parallel beta-helix repeat-containing protein [Acidobacteriota bacterium]